MSSLDTLKKSNSLDKLLAAAESENAPVEKQSYVDERMWKPELDKSGNGYAVIRFLPAPDGEDMPWAKLWNHAFQGPTGKWYIENSLTTMNQKDPVSEYNSRLWNSGVESDKEIARKQKKNCNITLTYMWYLTRSILKTKVKFSYSDMVKRFGIKSQRPQHQHLKMRNL